MSVLREEIEEGSDALVSLVRLAGKDPEARAAGYSVLRGALGFRFVGQLAGAVVHARLDDIAETARMNSVKMPHSPERKSCLASEVRPP